MPELGAYQLRRGVAIDRALAEISRHVCSALLKDPDNRVAPGQIARWRRCCASRSTSATMVRVGLA